MFLYWLANNNFGYYTKRFIEDGVREFKPIWFIRRLQCDLFGHNWFTFLKDSGWCAWCGRKAGKYPKMRVRRNENMESLQSITQQPKANTPEAGN